MGGGGDLTGINIYDNLISRDNLLLAWKKFLVGKKRQPAVLDFWLDLEKNIDSLYHDLQSGRYRHCAYRHFVICDPKRRDIYVAEVRDRLVHQVLSDYLNDIYESIFYFHSYASRQGKGLHKAVDYFLHDYCRLSRSGRVWAVKMDVRKFFSNVRHDILYDLLNRRIGDQLVLGLIKEVVSSFGGEVGRGLPLGNLTSQVLANAYMHELDFYIKNCLKIKYYLRYNDDLLFLCRNHDLVIKLVDAIRNYVTERLSLDIPTDKTAIIASPQVIDVLGRHTDGNQSWPRPQTIRRAKRKLSEKISSIDSKVWDSACSYAQFSVFALSGADFLSN